MRYWLYLTLGSKTNPDEEVMCADPDSVPYEFEEHERAPVARVLNSIPVQHRWSAIEPTRGDLKLVK